MMGVNEKGSAPGIPMVHVMDKAMKRLTSVLAHLGISALILAIVVVVGDIIWRRIGGRSFIGAVDLTQLSVVIAVSFSIPYAFAHGGHVTVDLLGDALSKTMLRGLDTIAAIAGALLMAFLLWLTWGRTMEIWTYGDVSQDLAVPMILFWGTLLCGLGLSVLACLVNAINLVAGGGDNHGD